MKPFDCCYLLFVWSDTAVDSQRGEASKPDGPICHYTLRKYKKWPWLLCLCTSHVQHTRRRHRRHEGIFHATTAAKGKGTQKQQQQQQPTKTTRADNNNHHHCTRITHSTIIIIKGWAVPGIICLGLLLLLLLFSFKNIFSDGCDRWTAVL